MGCAARARLDRNQFSELLTSPSLIAAQCTAGDGEQFESAQSVEPDKSTNFTMKQFPVINMRTRAQWYKAKAEQCSERAKAAPDAETKRIYEDMAQEWVDLAKRAEQAGNGA
jgi:hypothetical protein